MNFPQALEHVFAGKNIYRLGWNGQGIYVAAQIPDANSKMTAPYLYIDTTCLKSDNVHAPRKMCPWAPSQTDMFATDWQVE